MTNPLCEGCGCEPAIQSHLPGCPSTGVVVQLERAELELAKARRLYERAAAAREAGLGRAADAYETEAGSIVEYALESLRLRSNAL